MGAGADAEVMVRRVDPELLVEEPGELVVVVLPRVHRAHVGATAQRGVEGGGLDELGAVADNGEEALHRSTVPQGRAPTIPAMEDDPAELLVVVDAADRVLEHRRRAEVHADRSLLHRSLCVVVETLGGTLWQRRGFGKDTDPGSWDMACTGHVGARDPDVETAVQRELHEELGIAGDPVLVGRLIVELPEERELVAVYRLWHPGPFVVAPPEVAGLVVYPPGTRPEPLSPWSLKVLEWLDTRPDTAPAKRGGGGLDRPS